MIGMGDSMEAKVIVMKCGSTRKMFGVRIEKMSDGDWYRTWAFPLNENTVRAEGYDRSTVSGNLYGTKGFPGCPYCGNKYFYQCNCMNSSCWNGEDSHIRCPWCNEEGELEQSSEKFTVGTDAF